LDEERRARLLSEGIQALVTILRVAIVAGSFVLCIYFMSSAAGAFAGKETGVSFDFVARIGIDRWLAYMFGAGGAGYGVYERKLRQRNISRMRGQTHEFEKRADKKRTSSALTPDGKTRREDR